MTSSLNKNILTYPAGEVEQLIPKESWLKFSQAITFEFLSEVMTNEKYDDLACRLVNHQMEETNTYVIKKYALPPSRIGTVSRHNWADQIADAVKMEKLMLDVSEPIEVRRISQAEIVKITPELMKQDNESDWLKLCNCNWQDINTETREWLMARYGSPLMIPNTKIAIYSNNVTMGQCFDVELYFSQASNREIVVLDNIMFESLREHSSGALGVTNRLLIGQSGGIVLPWTFYEPSSFEKTRLKNIQIWQSILGDDDQYPTRAYTSNPNCPLFLKMGRPVGHDWRLQLGPNRVNDMKPRVDEILS